MCPRRDAFERAPIHPYQETTSEQTSWEATDGQTRHAKLAVLFGIFTPVVGMVTQLIVTAIMSASFTGETLISAAVGGVCMFAVSFLTVLFVWPRIGFDSFVSRTHETT